MAIAFTLIETAKLNKVDPQAWLTDALSYITVIGATTTSGFSLTVP